VGRVGAHVSAEGGLPAAAARAVDLRLECLQVFVGAPQRWNRPELTPTEVQSFRGAVARNSLCPIFVHAPYLVNLASKRGDVRALSVISLTSQLAAADAIGAKGVVVHVGSGGDDAMEQAITGLRKVLERHTGTAVVILENDAGSGHRIGRDFADLGTLLAAVDRDPRVRFCVDTAHSLAAGYEIRTPVGLDETLRTLDAAVGLARVELLHVNDSKVELGRNVDRHDNLGQGKIGLDALARIVTHPLLAHLPAVLEVPGYEDDGPDRPNVELLRLLTSGLPTADALDAWRAAFLPPTAPRPS